MKIPFKVKLSFTIILMVTYGLALALLYIIHKDTFSVLLTDSHFIKGNIGLIAIAATSFWGGYTAGDFDARQYKADNDNENDGKEEDNS